MATVSVNFGRKTRVNQVSAYKVEVDTPERLVLRAKKIGYYLGGAFLGVMGALLLLVGVLAVLPRERGLGIGLAVFGALLLWGGVALVRSGMRNEDRIVFDRAGGAVRFDMTKEKDRYAVPFAEIDRIELRVKDTSTASEERVVYPVVLVRKNGDEAHIDEATDVAQMLDLALKTSTLCGVRMADTFPGTEGRAAASRR
jgi:hypothetical protein